MQGLLTSSLASPSEEVKGAAAFALGGVTIGAMGTYLPFVLQQIQKQVTGVSCLHSGCCHRCQAVLLVLCALAGALAGAARVAISASTCLRQCGVCAGAAPIHRSS